MKASQALATALLASALAWLPAFAQPAQVSGQPDTTMTAASRQELIDKLSATIEQRYVFPDVGREIAARLRERQRSGAYDGIASASRLTQVLSQEMQALSKDRHLRVVYSDEPVLVRRAQAASTPEEAARQLEALRARNFGVERIERLPLNIGYLALDGFAPAQQSAETIAAAMTVLAHTDALIIDLRNNGGGDAAASTQLASYLLERRSHLADFRYRDGNRVEQRWSLGVLPGPRYGASKPVSILTSKDSFSAAEDFAYALKNLKRATVVGETTGGGANAGDHLPLLPHFAAFVPLSRLVSPVTGTNWEGVGVTPDVAVCAADALRVAQLDILKRWAAGATASSRRAELAQRIAELEARPATMAGCGQS
ncbi:S41 family peptidase [Massilia sp. KIM]|uniref:S41 family peptidase n=1 Tax=Massilia sp. KIM TaxID=1955422 RepID=UPI00098F2A69|nr:S41 family peptidase [Massilia sp. KIM]